MIITGRSSPSAPHLSHRCDGVARAGGQSGGGETKHGIMDLKYAIMEYGIMSQKVPLNIKVRFQCQHIPGESGRKRWQFDTRRTRADAEHECRSRQVSLFAWLRLQLSMTIHSCFFKREVGER